MASSSMSATPHQIMLHGNTSTAHPLLPASARRFQLTTNNIPR